MLKESESKQQTKNGPLCLHGDLEMWPDVPVGRRAAGRACGSLEVFPAAPWLPWKFLVEPKPTRVLYARMKKEVRLRLMCALGVNIRDKWRLPARAFPLSAGGEFFHRQNTTYPHRRAQEPSSI